MEYQERKRWVFFGLPFTFTKYTIREDVLTVDRGLLRQREDDCYMYKIQDVALETTLAERIFGLGTVICSTGDTTDPVLKLEHIKNARVIKEFLLEYSEKARLKRRTINTLDISAEEIDSDQ